MSGGRPIRVLNVAEKPSVVKAVAGILSRNHGLRTRDGRSRYNRIFVFDCTIRSQPCRMLVTSVTGRLMELDFDDHYRKWHSCDPADLYSAPVRKNVPQEIDLCIGACFTRFQTMLLKDAFVLDFVAGDRNLVLSYGPCQFPTVGFVVERYWEIQAHEPEEFWTINCSHTSDDGTATFNWMQLCGGSYVQRLLDPDAGLWRNPGSGGHDDKAHPPTHPTKFSAGESGWS